MGTCPAPSSPCRYECSNDSSGTLVLENGDTKGVGDLPIGATCTLAETNKPATTGPSYVYGPEVFSPSNIVTIVANDDDNVVQVTLTNPLEQLLGGLLGDQARHRRDRRLRGRLHLHGVVRLLERR